MKRRKENAEWTWEQSAVDRFRLKKTTGLTVENLEVVSSLLLSKQTGTVVLYKYRLQHCLEELCECICKLTQDSVVTYLFHDCERSL